MLRTCSTCLQELPITDFAKKNNGYNYVCKVCFRIYAKQHYNDNREKYIKKARKNNTLHIKKVDEFFRSIKKCCVVCSEGCYACLDFHHIDENKKDFSIANHKFLSIKKLQSEIDKCVVLCSNCHRKLHAGLITL